MTVQHSYHLRMGMTSLLGNHHSDELFVVDLTISINIGFTDHLIHLLISELLPKVRHDMPQLQQIGLQGE